MTKKTFSVNNYNKTKKEVDYSARVSTPREKYQKLGFKCGLEIHQQLKTKEKLFCHCPAGFYQDFNDYDAEVVRHMRPTLSELGEYDGTALMEFKTKKNITYRIKNETTCTYEIDDTPPFPLNKEALKIATEISMLLNLNIVGEIHITRKQYLDGSIPTGFQRTAIVGIEGNIPLENKNIRIIQLSVEEDSCREVSDIRHNRIFTTDRLGMPLIETVTYPDMKTPNEAKEAAEYLRFLARSTDKVRTGIGAARQDVNVSITGGTRVEIKGVAHNSWIPELTHNEAFRQKALLLIRDKLRKKIKDPDIWSISSKMLDPGLVNIKEPKIKEYLAHDYKLIAVNLPGFKGILSHFTQPKHCFADEISNRLKVIACLEKPNMIHSESMNDLFDCELMKITKRVFKSSKNDAQIIFWAPNEDIETALETIEERCKMAFSGIPNETRKSFEDGTTIFERVLPGPDRMYPDTDSAPIPISSDFIEEIGENLPQNLRTTIKTLKNWNVPIDAFTYILKNNLIDLIKEISEKLDYSPKFVATVFAHQLKHWEGQITPAEKFDYRKLYGLFKYIKEKNLAYDIIEKMLPILYEQPKMEFDSILHLAEYQEANEKEILEMIPSLRKIFPKIDVSNNDEAEFHWIMGNLRKQALGNVSLSKLAEKVKKILDL